MTDSVIRTARDVWECLLILARLRRRWGEPGQSQQLAFLLIEEMHRRGAAGRLMRNGACALRTTGAAAGVCRQMLRMRPAHGDVSVACAHTVLSCRCHPRARSAVRPCGAGTVDIALVSQSCARRSEAAVLHPGAPQSGL
jgi:hypothetical protein